MNLGKTKNSDKFNAGVVSRKEEKSGVAFGGHYDIVCRDSEGNIKWTEEIDNLVVDEGLNHILEVVFASGTQDTTWFVGLLAATPVPLPAWVAASLAAVDFVDYDEATLPAFVPGAVASESVDNSASKASFAINQDTSTIGGAFLIGTSAKATPAGVLYSAGAFTGGNKSADSGDTLEVTATFTSADDGV